MAELYGVIAHHATAYVSAAVNPLHYKHLFGTKSFPKPIRSPYYCCLLTIINKLPSLLVESGFEGPVEFIFDRQVMEEKHILEAWYWFEEAKMIDNNLIKSSPSFKDDKEVVPLQASDMLAGRMRVSLREEFALVPPSPMQKQSIYRPMRGYHFVWRKEDLKRLHDGMLLSEKTVIRGMFGYQHFVSMNFKGNVSSIWIDPSNLT